MAIPTTEKLKILWELATEPRVLRALCSLRHSGYLVDTGWFNAFRSGLPTGPGGEPLPWTTYPFTDFLRTRRLAGLRVFEYGAGYSTLFFAARAGSVTSAEHSREWVEKLERQLPSTVHLLTTDARNERTYSRTIRTTRQKFDIILVDGEHRVACLREAARALTRRGVIVLDDSERAEYGPGIAALRRHGFRSLDFWGPAPGLLLRKCTTLFYRTTNCLGV